METFLDLGVGYHFSVRAHVSYILLSQAQNGLYLYRKTIIIYLQVSKMHSFECNCDNMIWY